MSQGGEGVPRRVTPEENHAIVLRQLRAGTCDVARQQGWNLCMENEVERLREARGRWNQAAIEAVADALTESTGYPLDCLLTEVETALNLLPVKRLLAKQDRAADLGGYDG